MSVVLNSIRVTKLETMKNQITTQRWPNKIEGNRIQNQHIVCAAEDGSVLTAVDACGIATPFSL